MFGLFQSTTIPALEQSVLFSERRHELLASNIANLDTPGYRARDLDVGDFQNALAQSIQRSRDPSPADSVSPTTRDDIYSGPRATTEQIVYHDGSDVSLEHQVTQVSKNKHLHSLAISTMRSQFALLKAAISEQA
jgi:flagellar basal-body rod protein FlgB